MGKRSRKRSVGPVRTTPSAPARPVVKSSGHKSRMDKMIERADARPKAPWHPVPLVELSVLAGIILIIIGFINSDTHNGRLSILFGLALSSLAGLDTAVRDHFAGFQSHSTLLAGFPAAVIAAALAFTKVPIFVLMIVGVGVFVGAFFALRNAFRRRTGVGFKV
jgi:hypothetical protein